jgi:O-antigen/teichoic acid export membrane protein
MSSTPPASNGDRVELGDPLSHGEPALEEELDGPAPSVRGAATAFSDILSVSAARAASIALALISLTIVTHLLDPAQYAILAYIGVISGLIFTGTSSWTAAAVTRYGREELERHGTVRATSWGRLVITTPLLAVAILLVAVLKQIDALPGGLSWGYVALACASGMVQIAAEHIVNLLEACGRMKLTALAVTLQRAVSIVGLVALLTWGVGGSPGAIALILLAGGSILAAVLAAAMWKDAIWPPAWDRELFRRVLAFSLPLIAFAVSQYVIGAVDVVILGAYRPARDVGLYAISYQGYGLLQQIATTATIVLSPLFVSLRAAEREHLIGRYYERTVPQVVFLSSIGAGLTASVVGLAIPAILGRSFGPAAAPFAILLIAWVLYAAASFAAPILVLHERARAIGAINAGAALVNVVGDWLLIGEAGLGISGPALATAASLALIAVGYLIVAGDCIGLRPQLPLALIAPALVGVALALALNGALGAVAGIAGTLGTATVVFWRRRPFTAADVEMIGRLDIPGPFKALTLRGLARLG